MISVSSIKALYHDKRRRSKSSQFKDQALNLRHSCDIGSTSDCIDKLADDEIVNRLKTVWG